MCIDFSYVHSATFSCPVELYKQWYNLADFLPNWDISRGFFSICNSYRRIHPHTVFAGFFYILFAGKISESAMCGAEVGGHYTYFIA